MFSHYLQNTFPILSPNKNSFEKIPGYREVDTKVPFEKHQSNTRHRKPLKQKSNAGVLFLPSI